ncbi:MAG: hypothetical protein ACLRNQ_02370 [Flavonifractor plautii]
MAELDWLTHQGGFVLYPVLGIVAPEAAERLRPGPAEVKETFFVPVDWSRAHPPEVYAYPLEPRVGEDFPMPASAFPRATAGGAAGWRCPSTPGRDGPSGA